MASAAAHLAVFLGWNLLVGGFLLFTDPLLGLPASLLLAAVLLWGYLLRPLGEGSAALRWALLRLRPLPGAAIRWTALAVPTLLVLAWAAGDVYTRIVPVPPESLDPFQEVMRSWEGRLAISVFAVGVAPIIEEFFFRGLIQRTLERRFGPLPGILAAAALFALVHFMPWVFPLHFMLGALFGLAVYATRSIWTGVVLHAANNAFALIGVALSRGSPETTGSVWEIGLTADLWISVCALLLAGLAALRVGRGMLDAGRPARLPVVQN